MIPPFDEHGNLPPGIHWSSWEEIATRYGSNVHRQQLLAGLRDALRSLQQAGCKAVYINGSFVTDKELPADFDVCYELEGIDSQRLDPILLVVDNHREAQKNKFRGELIPFQQSNTAILRFFQRDKELRPKGIVGLRLRGIQL